MSPSTSKTKSRTSVSYSWSYGLIAMISGVISGFMGAMAGSLTFITTYNGLTHYFYSSRKYLDWDFRLMNLVIYLASDFSASFAKVFFEARKQLIQMQIYE